jgi:Abnormal spindle-like microcephaly-assoc'd, ASPM-SPD-2-Hydin
LNRLSWPQKKARALQSSGRTLHFTNSQAGGGIYAHGWNHNLEVSNNRVFSNGGTITGGIRFGQIEVPTSALDANGNPIPLLFSANAKVHNNSVTSNVSFGDEFNVDTPAAGGGVAFCTGSDFYHFNYNWVCGNLSTGNGGGLDHRGLSFNGDISHNTIIFNQSFNQTLDTHGGGIVIEGEPNPGNCAGPPTDLGCPIALSDGSGNVSIDSNVIMGNIAEGGSGGGVRLENVNGADVARNPNNASGINPATLQPWAPWWQISITNNVIANNEASWAGGGVSFFNAVNSTFNNNAVISNDATATAGVLFDTAGANQGATGTPPGGGGTCGSAQCIPSNPVTSSNFQPAGLETELHSPTLVAAFGTAVNCPSGQPNCTHFSNPVLNNDIFWQNRSFHITVGTNPTPGLQNVITLTPQLSQGTTGACPGGANYWDVGIGGDTSPAGGNPGAYRLSPQNSIVGTGGYSGSGNSSSAPKIQRQYCNGSRIPPEIVASICAANANNPACSSGGNGGHSVPPGIPDIDPFYPLFTLNPAATVDEGNNWINVRYGPLSLVNSSVINPKGTPQPLLGQYLLPLQVQPDPLSFGTVTFATTRTVTVTNPSLNPTLTGGFSVSVSGTGFSRPTTNPGSCGTTTSLAPGGRCTINVTFAPTSAGNYSGTLTITDGGANSPQIVPLSGSH